MAPTYLNRLWVIRSRENFWKRLRAIEMISSFCCLHSVKPSRARILESRKKLLFSWVCFQNQIPASSEKSCWKAFFFLKSFDRRQNGFFLLADRSQSEHLWLSQVPSWHRAAFGISSSSFTCQTSIWRWGLHSTEVLFFLLTQQPRVWFSVLPRIFLWMLLIFIAGSA